MASGTGKVRHYQLTLSGSAEQLSAAIADASRSDLLDKNIAVEWVVLQANENNNDSVRIGGDSTLTATDGIGLDAADAPFTLTGPLRLSDIWIIGTADDMLDILVKAL